MDFLLRRYVKRIKQGSILSALCLLNCLSVYAQPAEDFLSGSAHVTIEPGNSVISSALAGYGVPREGRFSIRFDPVMQLQHLKAVTSNGKGLFAVNNQGVLIRMATPPENPASTVLGNTPGLIQLVSFKNDLYGIDENSVLFKGILISGSYVWKKVSTSEKLQSISTLNGKLYGVNRAGNLVAGALSGKGKWTSLGYIGKIICLTADSSSLYGLNTGDTIWMIKPALKSFGKQQIARNNGITYRIKATCIAAVDKGLYAIDTDGKLYKSAHRTMNNLRVSALSIRKGKKTVVVIAADVCGLDYNFTRKVKAEIESATGIPGEAILINASHTHFAPVTQAWSTWGEFYHLPDSNYLNNVVGKGMIKAVIQSLGSLSPSKIFIGRGETHIGENRRPKANPEKPYDTTLDVLKIVDQQNRTTIMFSAGCHPVFENEGEESYTLNANYPAITRGILEKESPDTHALFVQGCGADINPVSFSHKQTGEDLAGNVISVLKSDMKEIKGGIDFQFDSLFIPVVPKSLAEVKSFREANSLLPEDIEAEKNVRWSDLMVKRYQNGTLKHTLPEYIQVINIGNWKFVGLSREVVTEYGPAVRAIWPDNMVTVAGYCNDVASYLPVDWHIRTGVYEGNGSFFWYGQPGLPPLGVLDRVVEKLRSISNR